MVGYQWWNRSIAPIVDRHVLILDMLDRSLYMMYPIPFEWIDGKVAKYSTKSDIYLILHNEQVVMSFHRIYSINSK